MTSQTMTSSDTSANCKSLRPDGFTLLELIVVLVIISAMVTVLVPYATRSNESLRLKQESLNMAEAVKYAINLSIKTNRPTRIIVDLRNRGYSLETQLETGARDFIPLEDAPFGVRYLGQEIHIMDMDGFDIESQGYYIVFDPARPLPKASLSLSTTDSNTLITMKIGGKQVEIEESTF